MESMRKESYVNQDEICTKCLPYSGVALLEVGCRLRHELPSSQSKEKKLVTKFIAPIEFKKKSCSGKTQLIPVLT